MKTKLLVTVAMAALITGSAGALAQEEHGSGGAAAPGAAQHQTAPGGAGGAATQQHGQAPGAAGAQTQMKPQGGAAEQKAVQGGAEERGNMQRGAQGEPGKAGANAQEHAQTQGKGDLNAQTEDRSKQENAQTQERGKTQENAQGNNAAQEHGAVQQNAQGKPANGRSVQLSETQRTQIKSVVVKDRNVARVDHVDFSINVGVAVPRSVHIAVLPADVIEVVPEYRGFEYVIVGEQLLIIDPNTMMIVDILPV
jgi:Protein of unknown function (DUF1236)